jgi:hypothetical protein
MFTKSNRSRMTMAVAGVLATLLIASPVLAATQSVAVKGYTVSGAIVQVTVKNATTAPISKTVAVQAVAGGVSTWSYVPVALSGGQTTTVSAAFTCSVSKVLTVGISDDLQPF